MEDQRWCFGDKQTYLWFLLLKSIENKHGADERIIHVVTNHGYELTVYIKPEHEMKKVLYTIDALRTFRP